jgi:malic enzyme
VLRTRAREFTDAMLVAAARALAAAAPAKQLLPDPLDIAVHECVSQAVQAVVATARANVIAANGSPQDKAP